MNSNCIMNNNTVESRLFDLQSSDIPYYETLFVVDNIFILLYSTFGGAVVLRDAELYTSLLR